MGVEAIKEAIAHLSGQERQQLAQWFLELEEDEWDRQMERDLSPGGRGAHLLRKLKSRSRPAISLHWKRAFDVAASGLRSDFSIARLSRVLESVRLIARDHPA